MYWYLQDQFFDTEDKYFYTIYSHDKNVKVSLLLNSNMVHVTYNQPLKQETYLLNNENDNENPININESQINKNEKVVNEIKYYKANKVFLLKCLPSYWTVPIKLLITHFKLEDKICIIILTFSKGHS